MSSLELLRVSANSGFPRGHLAIWSLREGLGRRKNAHPIVSDAPQTCDGCEQKIAPSYHNDPVGRTLILSAPPCSLGWPTSRLGIQQAAINSDWLGGPVVLQRDHPSYQ